MSTGNETNGRSGLSPEADAALDVILGLCGGDSYCRIISRNENRIVVEAESSDDLDFGRSVVIDADGRVYAA